MIIAFWNGVVSSLIGGVVSGSFAIIAVIITLKYQNKKAYPEKIVQLNTLISSLIFLYSFLRRYLSGSQPSEETDILPFPSEELITENFHNWLSIAVLVDTETYTLISDLLDEASSFDNFETLSSISSQEYDPESKDNALETEVQILSAISKTTLRKLKKRRVFYDNELRKSSKQ